MGEIRLRWSHQSGIQSLSLSSPFRTIWPTEDRFVEVIDQRFLPHEWVVVKLHTYQEAEAAIKDMVVRGAPLIGATAAYGIYLAAKTCVEENRNQDVMDQAFEALAMAKAMQEMLPPRKRNNNEPCRRSQGAHMFPPSQPQEGAPVKRKRGRPPLPRLSPIEAAQRMLEPIWGSPLPSQRVRGSYRQTSAPAGSALRELEGLRTAPAASEGDISIWRK